MTHEKAIKYQLPLSPDDHVFVFFGTRSQLGAKAHIIKFCIEYKTLVEGRWRKVVRYDNSHDVPHKHEFDWRGEVGEPIVMGHMDESDRIFNDALETVKAGYEALKRHFISTRRI